jgi:N-methylhydantoinase A
VIEARVAQPLGLTVEEAAEGVIRIANANMSRAIRSVSTERGYDLAQFALFAYGGAGPLHALDVAAECGISTVIVPQEPGTLCARGMLLSDISFDFVRSEIAAVDAQTWQHACGLFAQMEREARAWLERERVPQSEQSVRYHIDARYQGQNFEVIVAIPRVAPDGMAEFLERFEAAHRQEYGYSVPGRMVEIVNCRLQAVGSVAKAPLREIGASGDIAAARTGQRDVYFGAEQGWLTAPVYARSRLPGSCTLAGPALIEEMSSTVLLAPGQGAAIDRIGNMVIRVRR